MLAAYVVVLVLFLGVVLITRVPSTLHTPLMSATNMISGIVVVGGMIVLGSVDSWWLATIAFVAIVCATANVVGGFWVTDRMLRMFRTRTPRDQARTAGEQDR